jgi:hypothetical protein
MLVELGIFAAVLIGLDILVMLFGADTRDADDWAKHRRP